MDCLNEIVFLFLSSFLNWGIINTQCPISFRYRHKDQWNSVESPEINPCWSGLLVHDKGIFKNTQCLNGILRSWMNKMSSTKTWCPLPQAPHLLIFSGNRGSAPVSLEVGLVHLDLTEVSSWIPCSPDRKSYLFHSEQEGNKGERCTCKEGCVLTDLPPSFTVTFRLWHLQLDYWSINMM